MKYADISFFVAIRDFLTIFLPRQKNASEHTIKAYRTTLNLLLDFFNRIKMIPTDKISFAMLNRQNLSGFIDWLYSERKSKSASVNLRRTAIRTFIKYVAEIDVTKVPIHNDVLKVPAKRSDDEKIVEFMSENALTTLLAQPDTQTDKGFRNIFYMTIMYDTAARNSEIINLRLNDFVEHGGHYSVIVFGKGRKQRVLSLEKETAKLYLRYLELFHPIETRQKDNYLFYTVNHGKRHRMTDDCVGKFMRLYGEAAHIVNPEVPRRVHPHQLRHSRAMHLYRNGVQLAELQQILGHAQLETVFVYAYADAEMKRIAIEKAMAGKKLLPAEDVIPIYRDNDELIRKLYGLQ